MCISIGKAEGVWVYDETGKRYLDCQTAYTAVHFGHDHPRINRAITDQAQKIGSVPNAYLSEHYKPLVNDLCRLSGLDTVLLVGSTREAINSALDIAYYWGQTVKGVYKGKAEIIVCHSHIHQMLGPGIGGLPGGLDQDQDSQLFTRFRKAPLGRIDNSENVITQNTVALLLEPVQVVPEVIVLSSAYLMAVYDFCKEHNLLLIVDETLTDLGRMGKLFAHESAGFRPDILLWGNALIGGTFPLGVVLSNDDVIYHVPQINFEGLETPDCFPMTGSIARAALQLLVKDNLSEHSFKMGAYFLKRLKQLHNPLIELVSGQGLFLVVEFHKEIETQRIKESLKRQGILCKQIADHAIALSPPLVITEEEIDWAIDRINVVLTVMGFRSRKGGSLEEIH